MKWEGMWKEAMVVELKVLSRNLYGGGERIMKRMMYLVSAENRTRCHSNTRQKRTVVASFLGVSITEVCLQNFPCLFSRLVWQLHTSVAVLGRTIRFPSGLRLL